MVLFLSVCLFVIMLAQGMALRGTDLDPRRLSGAIWQGLLLKLLVMPLIAWGCAWMSGLSGAATTGLVLVALAPASVGALAFGGVLSADLPRLTRLIGLSSLACVIWLPLIGGSVLGVDLPLGAFLGTVLLPLVLGMLLAGPLMRLGQPLAMLASVLGGAMIVAALWRGWPMAEWAVLQAAVLLAVAVGVLGLYAARGLGQGGRGNASATALALLLAESAVPIGLTAQIWGMDFGPYALPAAIYGIAAYAFAVAMVLRRVSRRT